MSSTNRDQLETTSRSGHLDAGLHVFLTTKLRQKTSWESLQLISFTDLIKNDKDIAPIIEGLDINTLYLSLKQTEEETLSAVLPYVSSEQFQHIMDREAWVEDDISLLKLKYWLRLASTQKASELPARFFALEEELQLAALNQKVVVCTRDEFDNFQAGFQDRFTALPGNEIFYAFINVEDEEEEFLHELIIQGLAYNLEYTMSLLLHAHSLPPGEQSLLASQFRQARMQEDGYADYNESLELFKSLTFDEIKSALSHKAYNFESRSVAREHLDLVSPDFHQDFFDRVMEDIRVRHAAALEKNTNELADHVQKQLLFLTNALIQACKVEPSDLVKTRSTLQGAKALLSFGIELLSEGSIAKGVSILETLPLKSIFRFSHTLLRSYQKCVLERLVELGKMNSKILHYHRAQKFGLVMTMLEKSLVGIIDEPMFSLFICQFNRFPCLPAQYSYRKNSRVEGMGNKEQNTEHSLKYLLVASLDDFHVLFNETTKALALLSLARACHYDLSVHSNLDVSSYLMTFIKESENTHAADHVFNKHSPSFNKLKEMLTKTTNWNIVPPAPLFLTQSLSELADQAIGDIFHLLLEERKLLAHAPEIKLNKSNSNRAESSL